VATTLRAKGVFPEDHELSLGVFGYAGTRHATTALLKDRPDVLIVLGSGMNERDTMHWTLRGRADVPTLTIHVNTDMDELTTHASAAHIVPGNCRAFLELMRQRSDANASALGRGQGKRRAWLVDIKQQPRLYDLEHAAVVPSPFIRRRPLRRCERFIPAMGYC